MMNKKHVQKCSPRRYPAILIVTVFIMTATLYIQSESSFNSKTKLSKLSDSQRQDLKDIYVKTYKGLVSMDELNNNVYKKFGYEIVEPTLPVPILRMIEEPTCAEVFSDWQAISEQPQPEFPPKTIPWYRNDKNSKQGEKPRNWDKLSEMITWPKKKLGGLAYGTDGVSMYNAMKFHRLDEKNGVVIGSMQPWVEISALVNGAAKVLTVEYNDLDIQEEFKNRMSSILPIELVKHWQAYARKSIPKCNIPVQIRKYGDPIDPIGDIREVLKIKCMLKQGGLLFIDFPLGTDAIYYNAHRTYGPIRLAMLFSGFEILGTFTGNSEMPETLTSERLQSEDNFKYNQNTIVLRKL
ncbi:hypothetical protein CRE_12971 [Caenorhabditis remanei]|uniref:Uncharacterized protein n=1 Tax=Caenorhabditis remanei TaxID=31234 RepID=E3N121_CAERE|nr:hypothetical protein CRE_12971 [Caenorhabditis remanei]